MATIFHPTITRAGEEAAFNASNNGLELELTHIGFGSGVYDPQGEETAMVGEYTRVPIAAGSRITPTQVRINATWQADTGTYPITEIGIYAGNVLFAVFSRASGEIMGYKTAGIDFVFFYDFGLSSLPADSVNVLADTGQSTVLSALSSHLNDANAHPQYIRKQDFALAMGLAWCGVPLGSVNNLNLITAPDLVVPDYRAGMKFMFKASATNTGAMTVSVNGLPAKTLSKVTSPMVAGDITPSAVYEIVYDGIGFQMFGGSVIGGGDNSGNTGTTTLDAGNASTVATATIDGGVMSSSTTTDVLDGGYA